MSAMLCTVTNVRVHEGRSRARLPDEEVGVVRPLLDQLRVEDLDRARAAEARMVGAVHAPHAALPGERLDLVGSENRAHEVVPRPLGAR